MILLLPQNLPGGLSLGKGKYEPQMIATVDLRILLSPILRMCQFTSVIPLLN